MFTKSFWLGDSGVIVRAVRTWAQSAIASIGVGTTTNLFTADIKNVVAIATSSAIVSILMSLDRSAEVKAVEAKASSVVDVNAGQDSYDADCTIGTVR